MSARKLAWLDPFVDGTIAATKDKLPFVFGYLELMAEYFFELTILIVSARVYHLEQVGRGDFAVAVARRIGGGSIDAELSSPSDEIQSMVRQCLGIIPLTDDTVYRLRSVEFASRKNLYRRLSDAIEVMQDAQLLLLSLAWEDDLYESMFELDLNVPLDVSEEE